jgi:NAD(P)H-dependent flavin oxidoreductase YrpB (nitropropane dioxygenase family)
LRKQIKVARSKTNGVLGVNLMVALSDYDQLLQVALEEKVDVAFMGAGLPLKMPAFVLEQGFKNIHTKFVPKVSGAKAAKLIFNYWASKFNHIPDAVVVEGPLAGGHLGFKPAELENDSIQLSTLIKETVEVIAVFEKQFNKKIPVIAAGGIYSGADAHKIIIAGATAVKLGTRFVTTHECDANIAFKESYINSSKDDITLVASPVGLPGRVIKSDFVDRINAGETKPFNCPWKCLKTCDYKEAPYCISQMLYLSAQGKMDQGFAFAGSNAYKATEIVSVKEVFESFQKEYEASVNQTKFLVSAKKKEIVS